MTQTPQLDERFADWVDQRLPAAQLRQLERDLERDAQLRDAAHEYLRTVETVRVALAVEERAPHNFIEVVLTNAAAGGSGSRRQPVLAMWGGLAAAAGLVVWIAAGLLGGGGDPTAGESLAKAPLPGAEARPDADDPDEEADDEHGQTGAFGHDKTFKAEEPETIRFAGGNQQERQQGKPETAARGWRESLQPERKAVGGTKVARAKEGGAKVGGAKAGGAKVDNTARAAEKRVDTLAGKAEDTSEIVRALRLALDSRNQQLHEERPAEGATREPRPVQKQQEGGERALHRDELRKQQRFQRARGGRGAPTSGGGVAPPAPSDLPSGPLVLVVTVPESDAPATRSGKAGKVSKDLGGEKTTTPPAPTQPALKKKAAPTPQASSDGYLTADGLVSSLLPTPEELAPDGSLAGLAVKPADHLAGQLEARSTAAPKGTPKSTPDNEAQTQKPTGSKPAASTTPGKDAAYAPAPGDRLFLVTGTARELPRYFEQLRKHLAGRGPELQVQWAQAQGGPASDGKKAPTATPKQLAFAQKPVAPPRRDSATTRHSVWLVLRASALRAASEQTTRRR